MVLRNTSSELVEVPSEVVAGRWRRRRGTPTSSPNPFAMSWMSFGIIVATLVATCALILRQRQRDATIAPRIPIRTWPLVINPRNRELGGRENASKRLHHLTTTTAVCADARCFARILSMI